MGGNEDVCGYLCCGSLNGERGFFVTMICKVEI